MIKWMRVTLHGYDSRLPLLIFNTFVCIFLFILRKVLLIIIFCTLKKKEEQKALKKKNAKLMKQVVMRWFLLYIFWHVFIYIYMCVCVCVCVFICVFVYDNNNNNNLANGINHFSFHSRLSRILPGFIK